MNALGFDLGGTKVEAALLAPDGRVLWRQRQPTPAGDYAATVHTVAAMAAAAAAAVTASPTVPVPSLPSNPSAASSPTPTRLSMPAGLASVPIAFAAASQTASPLAAPPATPSSQRPFTIGIGTPGSTTANGTMKNCNSTCLNGRPLQHDLEAALGQPVALANDANCLALSEATDGAGAGAAVVFAAILGTGTGAGLAVHGRVLEGPNRLAGEWGHNPLPWATSDDPVWDCYCGRSGCVESLVSGPGLARDHGLRHGGSLDAAAIAARSAAGDAACTATLDRHAGRLARALAAVINLVDPDAVVLGGGLSLMPHLYHRVPALWGRWVFGAGAAEPVLTRLLPAAHGDASGVRGAAWLGRQAAGL